MVSLHHMPPSTDGAWDSSPLSPLGANVHIIKPKATRAGRAGKKTAAPKKTSTDVEQARLAARTPPLLGGLLSLAVDSAGGGNAPDEQGTAVAERTERKRPASQKRKFECFQAISAPPMASDTASTEATSPSKRSKDGKRSPAMKGSKRPWMPEEDSYLTKLVGQYGPKRWSFIASHFKERDGRVGKQCRERWQNHLDPEVSHQPWSLEEERQLMAAHADLGNRWVEIAKRIDGRTDSGCKNHFHKSAVQQRWKDVPVAQRWRAVGTPTGLVVGSLPEGGEGSPLSVAVDVDSAGGDGAESPTGTVVDGSNEPLSMDYENATLVGTLVSAPKVTVETTGDAAYALLAMMMSTPE